MSTGVFRRRFQPKHRSIVSAIAGLSRRVGAPYYYGSASNPADNGAANEPTTLAVTPPSNALLGPMRAGDLVALIGLDRIAAPASPMAISATGGQSWTTADITGANTADIAIFWCQFNGTWTADPSIIFAAEGGTIPVSAVMHVWRPTEPGTWRIDTAIAGGAEASASPTVITGITLNKRDTVTLAAWLIPNISTWGTLAGAGWAVTGEAQYRNSAGSDLSGTFAHFLSAAVVATGDVSKVPSVAAAVNRIRKYRIDREYGLRFGYDANAGIYWI